MAEESRSVMGRQDFRARLLAALGMTNVALLGMTGGTSFSEAGWKVLCTAVPSSWHDERPGVEKPKD